MTRLPEVISTVRRRRAWSTEEKVAILDAAFRPGGSVSAAADRFDVSRALIYLWRKQVRAGLMPGVTISEAGAAALAPGRNPQQTDAITPPMTRTRPVARTKHHAILKSSPTQHRNVQWRCNMRSSGYAEPFQPGGAAGETRIAGKRFAEVGRCSFAP